jgi:hypothetical protein
VEEMKYCGIDITIENPAGSTRVGDKWTQVMRHDYGYVDNTIAVDGDEVDCFVGPNKTSNRFFIVRQIDPITGNFDEYKLMFGFTDLMEAMAAYRANYQTGWRGFGSIQEEFVTNFKTWYHRSLQEMYASA